MQLYIHISMRVHTYQPLHTCTHAMCIHTHTHTGGRFFSPQYQAQATWTIIDQDKVYIDWGNYGEYELAMTTASPPAFEGSYKGKPTNWRKMALKRPFTVAEMKLLDSEWDFQHAGGSFAVEFRATIPETTSV
jgi:hypothetical protein